MTKFATIANRPSSVGKSCKSSAMALVLLLAVAPSNLFGQLQNRFVPQQNGSAPQGQPMPGGGQVPTRMAANPGPTLTNSLSNGQSNGDRKSVV